MTAPHATHAPGSAGARRAPGRREDRDTARPRSGSAQRALDRRQKRLAAQQSVLAAGGTLRETPAERALRQHREGPATAGLMTRLPKAPGALVRRMPFVLSVILLVGAGLGLTLWLSTGSAENSYDLTRREAVNSTLGERKAALERDVKAGESAPGLAQRATELGMVPAGTLPVLVADDRGRVAVVGKPAPATGAPKPALNPPAPSTSGVDGSTSSTGSGTPGTTNPGQAPGAGEQLVTMNSGTPTVANPPAATPAAPPRPQVPTPAPAPAAAPAPAGQAAPR